MNNILKNIINKIRNNRLIVIITNLRMLIEIKIIK